MFASVCMWHMIIHGKHKRDAKLLLLPVQMTILSNITGFIPLLIELTTPQIILLTNFSLSNVWPYQTSHHLTACSISTLVET